MWCKAMSMEPETYCPPSRPIARSKPPIGHLKYKFPKIFAVDGSKGFNGPGGDKSDGCVPGFRPSNRLSVSGRLSNTDKFSSRRLPRLVRCSCDEMTPKG